MSKLPTRLPDVVALPPPRASWLARARERGSFDAARHFLRYWKALLDTPPDLEAVVSYTCQSCGRSHELTGRAVWGRQFMVAGGYYDFAVRRLISMKASTDEFFPPGLNYIGNSEELIRHARTKETPHEVVAGAFIIHYYLIGLLGFHFTDLFRRIPAGNLPTPVFESSAHDSLVALSDYSAKAPLSQMRSCARILLSGLLVMSKQVYNDDGTWNKDHRIGPFSSIRLPELALLAKRDRGLLDRYGQHRADKVFEQQLALIMQSFGFVVVQTRRAERTVDLVCISTDPSHSISILVEAKTTTRRYALPVDDQRALAEYAEDVRRNLSTLPPLRLILVVGPEPGKTLDSRLGELENQIGVPVRFIPAQALADLREVLPGPLPLNSFLPVVLSDRSRVVTNLASPVKRVQQSVEMAHTQLVKTLLDGASGSVVTDATWDATDPEC